MAKKQKSAVLPASQFAEGDKDHLPNNRKLPEWLENLRGRRVPRSKIDEFAQEVRAVASSQLLPLFVDSLRMGLAQNDEFCMKTAAQIFFPPKSTEPRNPVNIYNKNMSTATAEAKAAAAATPIDTTVSRSVRFDDIVRRIHQQQEHKELEAAIDITPA